MRQYNNSPMVAKHLPCGGCGSSDAKCIREDGSGYCFSCATNFKSTTPNQTQDIQEMAYHNPVSVAEIATYSSYPLASRGISKGVIDHFNVKMSVDEDGRPEAHYYPYTKDSAVVAYKVRTLPKTFFAVGNSKDLQLFGQAQAIAGKILVITEGELDALAVAQANFDKYKKFYPVVSVPHGAGAMAALLANRDFIRQFESVVLMFDMDEPGQRAAHEACNIIGAGKVKLAKTKEKDPCAELLAHGPSSLVEAIWNAQAWSPAGIVMGEEVWEMYQKRKNITSIPYPECLSGLTDKLDGIRQGEITLFTSGTGSGKSTVIKEIILNLLATTDEKVGVIALEESVGESAEKLIGMYLSKPLRKGHTVTPEEERKGWEHLFANENLIMLDHQGSVADESLVDKIEHMALMGCKYLILDHITIAVSEGNSGLSGNEAVDKLMSDLLKMVKKHDVWLGLVSHLRKSQGKAFEEGLMPSMDDIKGSGSIKQISFDIIGFTRNLVAEEESERNVIQLRVLKARYTGDTGDAGCANYDKNTTRLTKGEVGFSMI